MQLDGFRFLQSSWRNRPIADQKPSQLIAKSLLYILKEMNIFGTSLCGYFELA
jgi:hypothetical protein